MHIIQGSLAKPCDQPSSYAEYATPNLVNPLNKTYPNLTLYTIQRTYKENIPRNVSCPRAIKELRYREQLVGKLELNSRQQSIASSSTFATLVGAIH